MPLDFFCTPPWATRALFRHVLPALGVEEVAKPVMFPLGRSSRATTLLDHLISAHHRCRSIGRGVVADCSTWLGSCAASD
jgi:hypothetical protein